MCYLKFIESEKDDSKYLISGHPVRAAVYMTKYLISGHPVRVAVYITKYLISDIMNQFEENGVAFPTTSEIFQHLNITK